MKRRRRSRHLFTDHSSFWGTMCDTDSRDGAVVYRDATREDLTVLVELYNHYVVTSHVTFDLEPQTVDERQAWFDSFSPIGPYRLMVAETRQRVVGYACSTQFRDKPAYRRSVETTIYLDPEFTGRGIGLRLYGTLLDCLRHHEDVHQAYAGVAVPNPGSIALHNKLGFEFVGTFRDAGYKFDRFWSVSWFQRKC